MAQIPQTLLLSFQLVDEGFSMERLLSGLPDHSWSEGWRMREMFAMSSREVAFVRRLLTRKRNLWLYRCNQRGFCGDFVVVDMSEPDASRREALVLELKSGASLKVGGGGVQVKNVATAVQEIVDSGVLLEGVQVTTWVGSKEVILEALGAGLV